MFDFHLERIATDDELADALRQVFNVTFVRLVEEITSHGDFADVQVLVVRWVTGGDFPLQVSVHPQSETFDQEEALAQRLCGVLACRCLISDDSPTPFSWRLVDSTATRAVAVAPDRLDLDELVLRC